MTRLGTMHGVAIGLVAVCVGCAYHKQALESPDRPDRAPQSEAHLTGQEATRADSVLIREWLTRIGYYSARLDVMPWPRGGMKAILDQIYYPREARDQGIEGRVLVGFLVDENGDVTETEVLQGIGFGCDEVARQVIAATKFAPAQRDGHAVSSRVAIPIEFRLRP
jgi:TonB family protein